MSTIFVQIASYRDQQLIPTIRDLLQNAAHPENITFGICWQHDETESLDEFKNDTRFRIMDVPHQESKGCCWARNLTQTLYAGETYTMQIDSHMRFIPNWDQECVHMMEHLRLRGYTKPILTGYPPSFFPEHDPEKRMKFPIRVKFEKFYEQGAVNLTPELLEGWERLTAPITAKYFSAGFCFADGSFVQDVPYDPNLFFRGEEITMTIRAYTHGYDFFHPHKIILWHEYTRPKAPKNNNAALMTQAHHRTNVFLGLSGENCDSIDFGAYGMGHVRTFADYEAFVGINFKTMDATRCKEMERRIPKKVSCVMTTYRRFSCVERSIAMFLAQDYHNKELIIYNTDVEHPLSLDASFKSHQHLIKIINNNIDMETKKPYTGVGAIRRDARLFADGEYFITWDDDDVFFPWNITQCVHGINKKRKLAWKPLHSMMKMVNAAPVIKYNYFEASVIADMEAVAHHGYNLDKTGGEHMKWFKAIKERGEMMEDADAVPGYCFYWSDPPDVAGHKQSNLAEYNRADNFARHKLMTTDHAKRAFKLTNFMKDYPHMWSEFQDVFSELQRSKPELFDRYISKFTQEVFSQKC